MAVLGFSHYNLRAPRALLEELRAFYTEVVGLSVGPRPPFANFGYWLYAGGRDVLHLSEARSETAPPCGADTTFDHAAFSCDGREAFERTLKERGVAYRIAHVPETRQLQLFFRDPAGHGIELNFEEPAGR
jgi:catechol-2,3-dioxygenase